MTEAEMQPSSSLERNNNPAEDDDQAAKKEEAATSKSALNSITASMLLPSPRKVLLSCYGLSILYAIPYVAISTLVPGYFIYGAHPGATDEMIDQSSEVVEIEGVIIGVFWVVFLFFVPFLLS
jgi:hypothetical protein